MNRGHPPDDVVIAVRAHQEQVRRGQHGNADAGAGEPSGHVLEAGRIEGRKLAHMTDGDTAAPTGLFGLCANVFDRHPLGVGIEVKMEVDIDVELPRQLENPIDLPARVRIRVGTAANHRGPAPQRVYHQLIGAGIVEQPFLGEDANLQIDRPPIFRHQGHDGIYALDPDQGIDLQVGAHAGGALENAFV